MQLNDIFVRKRKMVPKARAPSSHEPTLQLPRARPQQQSAASLEVRSAEKRVDKKIKNFPLKNAVL
jgi:hypothetical protein